jgi:hypothetical protein
MIFPKFVMMGNICALRLTNVSSDGLTATYYRDGGEWSVSASFDKDGQLNTMEQIMESISKINMYNCSFEKWKNSNGQYAPNTITE